MQIESEWQGKGLIQETRAGIKTQKTGKARLYQLRGLRRVVIARIYAIQYSAERKRKSMVYVGCVISAISCVISAISCVVSAMDDGNCSLKWRATVSVVQKSMW